MTWLLCLLCVFLTTAYLTPAAYAPPLWYRIGHFADVPADRIWNGWYLGLFTAMFLHGSLVHIAFNLYWLYLLGSTIEITIGPLPYALFVAGAAVVGSACELAVSGQTGIGASGVVYAFFGLMWAGRKRHAMWGRIATRQLLSLFVVWALICVVGTWFHVLYIANAAHVGGFLFGLSVGYLLVSPQRRWAWSLCLAALGALSVLSVTWMPWSRAWIEWKAGGASAGGPAPGIVMRAIPSLRPSAGIGAS